MPAVYFGRAVTHLRTLEIIPLNPDFLCRLLGDAKLKDTVNCEILNFTVNFICESNRFSGPLF